MPSFEETPSSPPGPGTSLEESFKYYKRQYELLESELADFQASSKDLEAELEKDIEASEKRERQLKEKATNLQYEVDEWKEKYKQAKTEAGATQNRLQKEVTDLRDQYRSLQLKLRDIEVANDDYERQQRNTESSLEDMQAQYDKAFEKSVMLEQEVQTIEQERESLRIDVQRLKDELQDFKIEAEILKEKLRKSEHNAEHKSRTIIALRPSSPRSELSPTHTNNSTRSFDTPPAKTASSPGVSETPTPPSPPISERSAHSSKLSTTPSVANPRLSMNPGTTPRQSMYGARQSVHARGPSISARPSAYRQSLSRSSTVLPSAGGLPQSSSIMQLRNLRGKMQKLEQRVQTARSKLPAPVSTPPRNSPRPESSLGQQAIPTSITLRSRRRGNGSSVAGPDSLPDSNSDAQSTPSVARSRPSRISLSQQNQSTTVSPQRPVGSMLPPRPSSRASGVSARHSGFIPSHSRPGSRASISNFRTTLGSGNAINGFAPNASTDRVRPASSLSDYRKSTYDGTFDDDPDEQNENMSQLVDNRDTLRSRTITPLTPRRTTLNRLPRPSDGGATINSSHIDCDNGIDINDSNNEDDDTATKSTTATSTTNPTPTHSKRPSLSGSSRLPNVTSLSKRQSGIGIPLSFSSSSMKTNTNNKTTTTTTARSTTRPGSRNGVNRSETTTTTTTIRPPSRTLGHVKETYDINETF